MSLGLLSKGFVKVPCPGSISSTSFFPAHQSEPLQLLSILSVYIYISNLRHSLTITPIYPEDICLLYLYLTASVFVTNMLYWLTKANLKHSFVISLLSTTNHTFYVTIRQLVRFSTSYSFFHDAKKPDTKNIESIL